MLSSGHSEAFAQASISLNQNEIFTLAFILKLSGPMNLTNSGKTLQPYMN